MNRPARLSQEGNHLICFRNVRVQGDDHAAGRINDPGLLVSGMDSERCGWLRAGDDSKEQRGKSVLSVESGRCLD